MAIPAKQEPVPDSQEIPSIVVFVKPDKEPARGAWFAASDHQAAVAGAAEMGMEVVVADSDDLRALAKRTPKGRVFNSGKLFAPRIQTSVFDQLSAHLNLPSGAPKLSVTPGAAPADQPSNKGENKAETTSSAGVRIVDNPWAALEAGGLVLAHDPDEEAWYEAIVIERSDRDTVTLKWRDYSDLPSFTRHVTRLAVLPPQCPKP